jgi:hypothetical protein
MKRKDASSVVVAVTLALILWQLLPALTGHLANKISGLNDVTGDWKAVYLMPVVAALLQVILLEIVIRLYVAAAAFWKSK